MADVLRRKSEPARWRTPAVVAGSLVIHAALLGPLALRGLGQGVLPGPYIRDIFLIPIDIEPRPILPGERPRVGLPPGRAEAPIQGPTLPRPADAVAATRTGVPIEDDENEPAATAPDPATATAAPTTAPTSGPAIDDGWAVRTPPGMARGFGPGGRLDCRDLIVLNAMDRAACEQRFENAAARAQAARIGERRLTRAESVREGGFAEQAAANEAWRDYRRGTDEGSYPGLRSMLKHF